MRMCSLAIVVFLGMVSVAAGRDIFVNNVAGDDLNRENKKESGDAGFGPCRTIAHALRIAETGDRIVLAATGQPYHESITISRLHNSGIVVNHPFEIKGNGAILDGSIPIPEGSWEHYRDDIFRFLPKRMQFQQLFINAIPVERCRVSGSGFRLPKLKPLQWCLLDRYIYFRVEKDKIPGDYKMSHTGMSVGITLYKVRAVKISDLTIQGFQLDGINANDAFQCHLVNVKARGNGRSGVCVSTASRVTIEASLIGNNGTVQLLTEGWAKAKIINSDLIANTAPAIQRKEHSRITIDGIGFHEKTLNTDVNATR